MSRGVIKRGDLSTYGMLLFLIAYFADLMITFHFTRVTVICLESRRRLESIPRGNFLPGLASPV